MSITINVDMDTKTAYVHEITSLDGCHTHVYARTVEGDGWLWCERCQCFVSSKCDHRRFMCKTVLIAR